MGESEVVKLVTIVPRGVASHIKNVVPWILYLGDKLSLWLSLNVFDGIHCIKVEEKMR